MSITRWDVETDGRRLRRLGKLGEELGELSAVTNRCIIQGIDQVDPSSGKTNRLRLEEEIADVWAQFSCIINEFNLHEPFLIDRANRKIQAMQTWEDLVAAG